MILIHAVRPDRTTLDAGKQKVFSADFTALALVFEKSAPDAKPNLLRCKIIVNRAVFNVKTVINKPAT